MELSAGLKVNVEQILNGECRHIQKAGEKMKNTKYYICPCCGNISVCTGNTQVNCCGQELKESIPKKASESQKLLVEDIDGEWYISSDHPMEKDNYISFVIFVSGGSLQIFRQYPEWSLQVRIPKRGHGTLLWYSNDQGFTYQLI